MFTLMSPELAQFFPEHNALVLAAQAREQAPGLEEIKQLLKGAQWLSINDAGVSKGLPARRSVRFKPNVADAIRKLHQAGQLSQVLPRKGRNSIPVYVRGQALRGEP